MIRTLSVVVVVSSTIVACGRRLEPYKIPAVYLSDGWDYQDGPGELPWRRIDVMAYIPYDAVPGEDPEFDYDVVLWEGFRNEREVCREPATIDSCDFRYTGVPAGDAGAIHVRGLGWGPFLLERHPASSTSCAWDAAFDDRYFAFREPPAGVVIGDAADYCAQFPADCPPWGLSGPQDGGADFFPPGAEVAVEGDGGADLTPFAVAVPSPAPLIFIAPDLRPGEAMTSPLPDDWPLRLRWSPGNGDLIMIGYGYLDASGQYRYVSCHAPDDGAFDLPPEWAERVRSGKTGRPRSVEVKRLVTSPGVEVGSVDREGHDRPLHVYGEFRVGFSIP